MKQLLSLFLFLVPCLAWAQYPTNGNQKITLGEQTTADGLVYRGVLADTGIITPLSDTSAYIILDTVNHRFYNYNRATNVWSVTTIGSISSGLTGVLPVANGGTGQSTLTANKVMVGNGTAGVLTPIKLHWDNSNIRLGVNVVPQYKLHIAGPMGQDFLNYTENDSTPITRFGMMLENSYAKLLFNSYNVPLYLSSFLAGSTGGVVAIQTGVGFGVTSERMRVSPTGNVGIGQTNPTAVLHLKAGTATASTAPLKFTSQGASLLNPVEAGVVEFNGTNLLFTPSTTRHTVNHGLTGSATLNFPSTLTLLSADLTITVTGAADGDVVSLGVPNAAVNANTSYSAWVSAANTVTVRFNNYSAGTVDPASGSFKVFVTK